MSSSIKYFMGGEFLNLFCTLFVTKLKLTMTVLLNVPGERQDCGQQKPVLLCHEQGSRLLHELYQILSQAGVESTSKIK